MSKTKCESCGEEFDATVTDHNDQRLKICPSCVTKLYTKEVSEAPMEENGTAH